MGSGTTLGLAAAAYTGGVALGQLADKLFGITPALAPLTAKLQEFVSGTGPEYIKQQQFIALALHGFATEVGGATDESAKLEEQAKQNRDGFAEWAKLADELGGALTFTKEGLAEITLVTKSATDAAKEMADRLRAEVIRSLEDTGIAAQAAGELVDLGFRRAKDSSGQLTDTLTSTLDTFTQLSHANPDDFGPPKALSKTFEEALKAQEQINQFDLEWEKIQSQNQIEIFRIQADVDIAAIQAGTEQIKAAFESVNTTVKSTGDTISSLVHDLANVGTAGGAGQEIIHLLEDENRRREKALELQQQLVEAQSDYFRALIDRLSNGEAFIQITSDGLEVELEQFMLKILERIQVRASSEAQTFLLGLPNV